MQGQLGSNAMCAPEQASCAVVAASGAGARRVFSRLTAHNPGREPPSALACALQVAPSIPEWLTIQAAAGASHRGLPPPAVASAAPN